MQHSVSIKVGVGHVTLRNVLFPVCSTVIATSHVTTCHEWMRSLAYNTVQLLTQGFIITAVSRVSACDLSLRLLIYFDFSC